MSTQFTLGTSILFEGVGVHSGAHSFCIVHPKQSGGIVFQVQNETQIHQVSAKLTSIQENVSRQTILSQQGTQILTPEHLLSALYAFGIDHALIELKGSELPILDGSALPFAQGIHAAGLKALSTPKEWIVITEPMSISTGDIVGIALPSDHFHCSYVLDYANPFIGHQTVSFDVTGEIFLKEIAAARTFGLRSEYEGLLKAGLAKGASEENVLVIGENGFESELRHPNECARHKLLDLIGDLSLLGRPIKGHIIGIKTGHQFNHQLSQAIHQQFA